MIDKTKADYSYFIENAIRDNQFLTKKLLSNAEDILLINHISKIIANAFQNGNKVLICGNGGSLCDAIHFAEEFTGKFRKERLPLPVLPLADNAHITCVANDFSFEEIFSRSILAHGKKNDILITLSTSGNSQNILNATLTAKKKELITVSFLGKKKCKAFGLSDFQFFVPGQTSDRIQEIHMMLLHIIIEIVERILFPLNYEINNS